MQGIIKTCPNRDHTVSDGCLPSALTQRAYILAPSFHRPLRRLVQDQHPLEPAREPACRPMPIALRTDPVISGPASSTGMIVVYQSIAARFLLKYWIKEISVRGQTQF